MQRMREIKWKAKKNEDKTRNLYQREEKKRLIVTAKKKKIRDGLSSRVCSSSIESNMGFLLDKSSRTGPLLSSTRSNTAKISRTSSRTGLLLDSFESRASKLCSRLDSVLLDSTR